MYILFISTAIVLIFYSRIVRMLDAYLQRRRFLKLAAQKVRGGSSKTCVSGVFIYPGKLEGGLEAHLLYIYTLQIFTQALS